MTSRIGRSHPNFDRHLILYPRRSGFASTATQSRRSLNSLDPVQAMLVAYQATDCAATTRIKSTQSMSNRARSPRWYNRTICQSATEDTSLLGRRGNELPTWPGSVRTWTFFWPVAWQGYEEHGRGAIVVDTTQHPTGESHPFGYFPQALVEQTGDEDTQRMVKQYDPSWEMVTVLLNTHDRTATYRVGVTSRKPKE